MNKTLRFILLLTLVWMSACGQSSDPTPQAPTATAVLQYQERLLTDPAGDADPAFIDILSTRVSQVEGGFIEIEFTVTGEIPLSPDPAYGNVIYRIWVDSNYETTYPLHGGGNAEYVLDIAYYNSTPANKWQGVIFDCALDSGMTAFEVSVEGAAVRARVPLSLINNPASFRYSYESFTDLPGKDGDPNAAMDEIKLIHPGAASQPQDTPTLEVKPTEVTLPTRTLTPTAPPAANCASGFTRLEVGGWAAVTAGDLPNRVRSEPTKTAEVIANIYPGAVVKVLEGPVCADGLIFWKVENETIPGGSGWTAEGDGRDYWLEPYAYLPKSVQLSAYGVSFSIPGSWSDVPDAIRVDNGSDMMCTWPEHIKIILTTYPARSAWKPTIYVYRTADKPDWYPICPGAPLLRTRQHQLLRGARNLIGSTNAQPIFNSELIYAYKGETPDGKHTVFAFFPVNFPLLAYSFRDLTLPAGGIPFNIDNQDWSAYYQEVGEQLESARDSDFTPPLDLLDAIVESVTVTSP